MMTNKVLIKLYIPFLDSFYDVFIPTNEVVWRIVDLLQKDVFNNSLDGKYALVNAITGEIYSANTTIYESNIRNGTELILIKCL